MPIWLKLYRNSQTYGIPAVFGRETLYPSEMEAMTVTNNVISAFEAREASKDWTKWEQVNGKAAELLGWASKQFKKYEAEWQNESR
jgi:hypothetical protein